jgi:hypothetical protein
MVIAERLFWAALALQVLHWPLSSDVFPRWLQYVVFGAWVVVVPAIGFLVGRSGGTVGHASRFAGLLALAWFVLGSVGLLFGDNGAPNAALTALLGFAISCLLGALVLVALAALSVKLGRSGALQPNTTPHADARDVPESAGAAGARAGGRER